MSAICLKCNEHMSVKKFEISKNDGVIYVEIQWVCTGEYHNFEEWRKYKVGEEVKYE